MINLQNITRITVNCLPDQQTKALKMLKFCLKGCTFNKIKFFTSEAVTTTDNIEIVNIPKINNLSEYNDFMLLKLNQYIDTDFCLVTQVNGFIINPHLWDDNFLNYDYIGAPWFDLGWNRTNRIGNGGFSLRSKKLLELCTTWKKEDDKEPEDTFISKNLDKFNLKYPDPLTALKFSIEWPGIPDNNWEFDIKKSFGFHSETIYNKLHTLYPDLFNK